MKYKQLTEEQRYQIYGLLKASISQKEIAEIINVSPSTVSREIRRNKGLKGYRPAQAQRLSDTRRKEAYKATKVTGEVYQWIELLIRQEFSPQQVVDYLKREKKVSLHHETVYQIIYQDKENGGDLYTYLRVLSKPYRKRYGHYDNRGKLPNRVCIDERPTIVERKMRIGDWEGDTIIGKNRKGALLTLVERKTLYTIIVKLDGKHADKLASAAVSAMMPLKNKVKTITLDNGLEFAHHERIAKKLKADIYFAHPYSSWERGINENTNGLIRQYFPKNMDLRKVTDEEIRFVMERLNNRPRKTRGGRSPNELFMGLRANMLAA